ncbi:hypothetical protein ACFXG4_23720 [Nocardia sp. NPDC059246]|uniref:hypothetical protein n=1 Tax=unclassified Nocardia TaxID=2637762 RepID=UPI003677FB88
MQHRHFAFLTLAVAAVTAGLAVASVSAATPDPMHPTTTVTTPPTTVSSTGGPPTTTPPTTTPPARGGGFVPTPSTSTTAPTTTTKKPAAAGVLPGLALDPGAPAAPPASWAP